MELEMLIIFSSVGLIVATVLWLTLPWEHPESSKPVKAEIWSSLDHLLAPHREPAASRLTPKIAHSRDR